MHFIPSLALTLAMVAVLTDAAVVLENGLPVQWDKAQLSELPVSDGVVKLDPWNYHQRMGLYQILINATNPFMGSMGPGNSNPLWGLPMQLGWKLKSGRLADPTGVNMTCGQENSTPVCIATNSWWGCVNYFLSVIPFLAAVEAGVVGGGQVQVEVQVPEEVAVDYCTSSCSTVYPDAMSKWATFFKQSLSTISQSELSEEEKKDQILGLMWAAQQASLQSASTSCAEKQKQYSRVEVSFSESWLTSAVFVSTSHFHSSMENSERFMTPLPGRVLLQSDSPPNIPDLTAEENHTLYIFSWMNSINRLLGGALTSMWQRAMCSVQAQEKGRMLLDNMVLNPKFALPSILSILREMITNC